MLGEDRLLVGDADGVGGERRAVDDAVDLDLPPRRAGQPADVDLPGQVDEGQLAAGGDGGDDAPFQDAERFRRGAAGDRGLDAGRVVAAGDAGELDRDAGVGLLEGGQDLQHRIPPLGVVAPHGDRHRVLGAGADGERGLAESGQGGGATGRLQQAAAVEAGAVGRVAWDMRAPSFLSGWPTSGGASWSSGREGVKAGGTSACHSEERESVVVCVTVAGMILGVLAPLGMTPHPVTTSDVLCLGARRLRSPPAPAPAPPPSRRAG